MVSARYRLPDEPSPSGSARYAVQPLWPLLASMLGNSAIGLAWFAFNAHALGTPTRKREYAYIATSLFGSAILFVGLRSLETSGLLEGSQVQYAALSLIALKLSVAYALFMAQQRSVEIWEHFGGRPANGLPVLALAFIAGPHLLRIEGIPQIVLAMLR